MNIGVIALGTLGGLVVFNERLSCPKQNWRGLAVIAIV
jgi:hypothetical protein